MHKMRVLLLFICALVSASTSKGDAPLDQSDEKLFEFMKRLISEDAHLGNNDLEKTTDPSPSCVGSTKVHRSIIDTAASLDNGARFLALFRDTESSEECTGLCCKTSSCDAAVYENKGDHRCYLFHCAGMCEFAHHVNYVSIHINHPQQSVPAIEDQWQEDPLFDSDNQDEDVPDVKTSTTTTSTTSTTTTGASTTTTAATITIPTFTVTMFPTTATGVPVVPTAAGSIPLHSEEKPAVQLNNSGAKGHHGMDTGAPSTTTSTSAGPQSKTAGTSKDWISQKKMKLPEEQNDLFGPVMALSVGLAFTTILLIFVTCRACKKKRQLRKRHGLHCHEADYLINGMYL